MSAAGVVSHGADTGRLRAAAEGLSALGQRAANVEGAGTTQLGVLVQAWVGADTDRFAADWHYAAPQLLAAADRLTSFARLLVEQAQQQDDASAGGGSGSAGSGSPAAPGGRPDAPDWRGALRVPLKGINPPTDWLRRLARNPPGPGWAVRTWADAYLDGYRNSDMTWFEALFVPWMWPEKWRNTYLDVLDSSTDWMNDWYKRLNADSPGHRLARWGLNWASDRMDDLLDSPLTKSGIVNPLGPLLAKSQLEEWDHMIRDPKGWWDQASGLDQAFAAGSVIVGAGQITRFAAKTTKDVFDLLAKGSKVDARPSQAPKNATPQSGTHHQPSAGAQSPSPPVHTADSPKGVSPNQPPDSATPARPDAGDSAKAEAHTYPHGGKGQWEAVHESMSDRARAYQEQITGRSADEGWVITNQDGKRVKFDGKDGADHIDAKGPGYAKFLDKNGDFAPWWRGQRAIESQAMRQVESADGDPVVWVFAERDAADAVQDLLIDREIDGITIKVVAPKNDVPKAEDR